MSDHAAHKHGHHSDSHGHGHEHGDNHNFAAANKEYFDKHAHNLEEMHPKWREMARKEVEVMRSQWPALFDKERTEVLDFACGIGASRSLQGPSNPPSPRLI